ncbi:MAG: hypothetical protein AAF902_13585 [Chloroflexota bacterium]
MKRKGFVGESCFTGRLPVTCYLLSGNFSRFRKTRAFYDQCSRLAYACHHEELYQDEEGRELVAELRDWVVKNRV